jgi:hypothetical protein
MVDFSKLRTRSQNGQSGIAALQKKLEATSGYSGGKDDRFWKWTFDAAGKSENIIRFLPIPYVDMVKAEAGEYDPDELTPAAKIVSHWFQGPKGWYKENSLQTFGEDCPVREMDTPNWKKRNEMGKETAEGKAYAEILKKRLPSEDFICGIYIVRDKNAPENEGKVKLFKYSRAMEKIINSAAKPEFDNIQPIDPFDIIEGANLILNLTSEEKEFNGRKHRVADMKLVSFGTKGPLFDSEERMEEVWKQQFSIMEFYDRKNFKTYDQLKALLIKVMDLGEDLQPKGSAPRRDVSELGAAAALLSVGSETSAPKEEAKKDEPKPDPKPEPEKAKAEEKKADPAPAQADTGGDEMDEFERLLANA